MLKLIVTAVVLCFIGSAWAADSYPYDDGTYNNMMAAFFSTWNRECHVGSQTGVCMHKSQCRREEGSDSGTGCGIFGVCCIRQTTCGRRITRKMSYVENMGYNSGSNRIENSCAYTVVASSPRVCQVRLDFEVFSLAQPDQDSHRCEQDRIDFAGNVICGENSGQHVYLPLNYSNGERQIEFRFELASRADATALVTPRWRIRVTQLECPERYYARNGHHDKTYVDDSFWIAPPGCLQYYPQREGEFSSFNLRGGDSGPYMTNLHYAICFRRQDRTDHLELNTRIFQIASNPNDPLSDDRFDQDCQNPILTGGSSEDYLELPGGEVASGGAVDGERHVKFCGILGSTVVLRDSSPGPLYLIFHSDDINMPVEIGFRFRYVVRH